MSRLSVRNHQRKRRIWRHRARLSGTAQRPRLCLVVSNRHVDAQLIDDEKGHTMLHLNSRNLSDIDDSASLSLKAARMGELVGKAAKKAKISSVVLDRRHRRYHGRVKAFAEAARNNGLEI